MSRIAVKERLEKKKALLTTLELTLKESCSQSSEKAATKLKQAKMNHQGENVDYFSKGDDIPAWAAKPSNEQNHSTIIKSRKDTDRKSVV